VKNWRKVSKRVTSPLTSKRMSVKLISTAKLKRMLSVRVTKKLLIST